VVGERQIVLPAFGEFVGGSLVTPSESERALIATARGVFDVTPGAPPICVILSEAGSAPKSRLSLLSLAERGYARLRGQFSR
jgi:hypothetical protein